MTKLTKKVALSYAVAILTDPNLETDAGSEFEFSHAEIVAKLTEMIDSLDKKSTAPKKMTDQQVANESYKVEIEVLLADGQPRTATEILNSIPAMKENDVSNQRVTALLRQLKLAGKVKSETVKGKSLFSTAEGV
jgi:thioredoxin-like negative regulator of GroEL